MLKKVFSKFAERAPLCAPLFGHIPVPIGAEVEFFNWKRAEKKPAAVYYLSSGAGISEKAFNKTHG